MVNNNNNRCKVKICGITSVHDSVLAKDAGADYVGILVDVASSERSLQETMAIGIADECPIPTVLLLYNRTSSDIQDTVDKIRPKALQLLGQETPSQVEELKKLLPCQLWKSVYLPAGNPESVDKSLIHEQMQDYTNAGADYLLFDTVDTSQTPYRYGGTGKTCDWGLASELIPLPVFFAGGIRPDNVKNAIETMNPYGIDLCSGVEASKGVKDNQKLISLMDQIKKARI